MYYSEFERLYCQDLDYVAVQDVKSQHFINWFRNAVAQGMFGPDANIQDLARGPSSHVRQFKGYMVNGYRFHTTSYGVTKGTSNSGVCVRGETGAVDEVTDFYGKLEDVVQLDFGLNSVVLFKCKWYDTTTTDGVWKHDRFGLVEINPRRKYPLDEPFILAEQAHQVYYSSIPGKRRGHRRRNWWAVYNTRARHVIEEFTETDTEQNVTSDEEDDNRLPTARGIIFQDNTLPRLRSQARQMRIDNENNNLATGQFVEINEPIHRPAPPPTDAELFNNDMEIEEHETDSDSDS